MCSVEEASVAPFLNGDISQVIEVVIVEKVTEKPTLTFPKNQALSDHREHDLPFVTDRRACGHIIGTRILTTNDVGFANFAEPESANRAVQLFHGMRIGRDTLNVVEQAKEERPSSTGTSMNSNINGTRFEEPFELHQTDVISNTHRWTVKSISTSLFDCNDEDFPKLHFTETDAFEKQNDKTPPELEADIDLRSLACDELRQIEAAYPNLSVEEVTRTIFSNSRRKSVVPQSGEGNDDEMQILRGKSDPVASLGFGREDHTVLDDRDDVNPRPEQIPNGCNSMPCKAVTDEFNDRYVRYSVPAIGIVTESISEKYENFDKLGGSPPDVKRYMNLPPGFSMSDLFKSNYFREETDGAVESGSFVCKMKIAGECYLELLKEKSPHVDGVQLSGSQDISAMLEMFASQLKNGAYDSTETVKSRHCEPWRSPFLVKSTDGATCVGVKSAEALDGYGLVTDVRLNKRHGLVLIEFRDRSSAENALKVMKNFCWEGVPFMFDFTTLDWESLLNFAEMRS
ncbi:unnamed protein product [Notodromas monacha]|uniref:Uncharacterized protein n=1 Tax=Notodromas monacha TaxID=399045 RepID=A0A7R9BFS5_9CRUS|nr:unnamed protein product [Notodromas monacha]CAG0914639.1 unnamed protein product [Notodromas monacha]